MDNFREISCVRALLVVLVVLFVCGAGMPGEVFAKVDMMNGHEGDPGDSYDMAGGGGSSSGDSEQDIDGIKETRPCFKYPLMNFAWEGIFFIPVFQDEQFVLQVYYLDLNGRVK